MLDPNLLDPTLVDIAVAQRIAEAPDDEDVTVACLRAHYIPAVPSSTHQCASCDRLVWISQRILDVLPARARILCIECAEAS